jgi:hypothetical protein
VRVSKHASDRMGERVGLSVAASTRLASKALESGFTHAETNGRLHRFLDGLYLRHQTASNMRLYGEHVYLFAGQTLVTVIALPNQFKQAVAKMRRRLEVTP